MTIPCEVWSLGRVPYADALALQERLVAERAAGAPDRLLLLEHPPVFTLGSAATAENVLWNEAERARRGIELVHIDRGGDVTYHGPGQLVAYPILQLPRMPGQMHANVVGYVRGLERALIAMLATYGVEAGTIKGLTPLVRLNKSSLSIQERDLIHHFLCHPDDAGGSGPDTPIPDQTF